MKRLLLILLILLFPLVQVHSEELTLEDCIKLALKNNNRLKAFEMDANISEQDMKLAFKGFLPSSKLKSHYSQLDKPDRFLIGKNIFSPGVPSRDVELYGERGNYGLQLSIEQPIFTGGHLTHSFKKSKLFNEEAQLLIERQKKFLRLEVVRAFHETLREKFYLKILEKIIESKKERLRVSKERYREGYVQREDVIMLETDLSNVELDLYKVKNRESFSLSKLRRLIYSDDDSLSIKGKPGNFSLTLLLPEAKEIALKNREDFKITLTKIKAAEEDIEIAKSGFYPKLSLQGQYIRQNETITTRPQVWNLMTQIEWTIFDWNKTKVEVNKAGILRKKLIYEREELNRAIMLETEEAWRTIKVIEKEVETKEKSIKTAEYRLKQRIDQYADGKVKLLDIIETEAELIKTYNEYLITLLELNISLAHIENSVSTFLEEWCIKKEIYRPDFDVLSRRKEELLVNPHPEEITHTPYGVLQVESNSGEHMKNDPKEVIPSTSKNLAISIVSEPIKAEQKKFNQHYPLILQVGAYKDRQNAERHRNYLIRKIGEERVKIRSNGRFHKVLITGFEDKKEVESFIKELGIINYLIQREASDK